ncbi:MAG: toll/interleukin-1 receptor domain-containing protein [Clostridia bacterium]|nr:toll/interleukin-1 receptor domain-containing protein [Clostridia bacterium]
MDLEKCFKGEGGYVFVSHSHLDIKEVREVRNFLEDNGIEPILFYLRSMEHGGEEKIELLRSLIYEEIDSREFFLYLDSEHAKKSKWVQEEVNYIMQTAPEKVFTASLDGGVEGVKRSLKEFLRKMRVYISSSGADRALTARLKKALLASDFRVYEEEEFLSAGGSWFSTVKRTLKDISKEGTVVALLTERSIQSSYIKIELETALRYGGRVLPILVGDLDLTGTGLEFLSKRTHFRLENPDSDEELKEFVLGLKELLKR